MATQAKWFVLYDTTYLPETAIRLGQLIVDPRKPWESLQDNILEIDRSDTTTEVQVEEDFVFQKDSERKFDIGFSAAVLNLLPFGFGGETQKGESHQFIIQKVESRTFRPSRHYVRMSVLQPEVLRYLARHHYNKSLFMIVGIKIGFNGEIKRFKKSKKGGSLNASQPLPSSLSPLPLDFGVTFGQKKMTHYYESRRILSSFVFAYRLREVRYYKSSFSDFDFTKGAELHCLYTTVSSISVRPVVKEPTYVGKEDEVDIDGLFKSDFEEDEIDTRVVDGCIMVNTSISQ